MRNLGSDAGGGWSQEGGLSNLGRVTISGRKSPFRWGLEKK